MNTIKDGVCLILIMLILLFIYIGALIDGIVCGKKEGRNELIQELCERQEYDFCQPVVVKTKYKLKEFNDD